jgi:hypothetical protein
MPVQCSRHIYLYSNYKWHEYELEIFKDLHRRSQALCYFNYNISHHWKQNFEHGLVKPFSDINFLLDSVKSSYSSVSFWVEQTLRHVTSLPFVKWMELRFLFPPSLPRKVFTTYLTGSQSFLRFLQPWVVSSALVITPKLANIRILGGNRIHDLILRP